MSNSLTKYRFSGHETFPIRYGWIEKMTDFINNNAKEGLWKYYDQRGGIKAKEFWSFNSLGTLLWEKHWR